MDSLEDSAKQVLGDFMNVAAVSGLKFVVIGAGARVLWSRTLQALELDPGRLTSDWDLAVSVDDWDRFNRLTRDLTAGSSAPFRLTAVQHRLIHRATRRPLDIVPFGGVEAEPGRITWADGATMEVTGFAMTLETHEVVDVEGLLIPFAPLQMQAVMKAIAYLDRRGLGTNHDVADLVWVLRNYGQGDNEARVFDEIPSIVIAHDVEPYAMGAALLGHDLRPLAVELLVSIRAVLMELMVDSSPAVRDARSAQHSTINASADAEVHHLAQAALWGFDTDILAS